VPKIVDHAQRRRDIILATWRVIARGGLTGATTREIAKEAGCSTGVLAHYFTDRADILASALVMAHQGVRERAEIVLEGRRGLSALRLFMIECLPLDRQRRLEARIEACFWGEAVGNEPLMKLQNQEVDRFLDRVRDLLAEAEADGEVRAGIGIDRIAREFHILMDGLSIQSVLYPARADEDTQIALLDALLDRIRATGSA
jgi:AcrR family transcriptional regulator